PWIVHRLIICLFFNYPQKDMTMILRPIVHSKIGCGKLFPELYPQKNLDDINGGCWYAFANERE
ncbi:MAG: hypothetical protein WAX34_08790, partial [Trichococcus flocculiformis]